MSIHPSVSKSVFPSVHRASNVPAALTGDVSIPTASAVGIWLAKNYDATKKAIPNSVSTVALQSIVTRNPRGVFTLGRVPGNSGAGGFLGGGFDGMTVTEKYAANVDGLTMGTRIVFASTVAGLRYRNTVTLPAGTYTVVIQAKSNTGSSQGFLMSHDGGSTTSSKTATTSWQTFTHEFTLGSSTSCDFRFMLPTASGSGDFVIDNAFVWSGAAATVPSSITWGGHLLLGNSTIDSISCTGGELALTSAQAGHAAFDAVNSGNEWSIYATIKRTTTYQTAGSGRFPFFFIPPDSSSWGASGPLSLGDWDAEGYLYGVFGSKYVGSKRNNIWTAGDNPNLFTDGSYHVISMKLKGSGNSNNNTIELWIDDCCTFVGINTSTQASINWFVSAIGGNNGLSCHKVNSLACYAKYHTEAETKQTVAALIANAAASSLTVTKPKNLVIAEGDSITVGPANNSYAQQAIPNLTGTGLTLMNWSAVSGSKLTTHTTTGLNVTDRLTAFHEPGIPDDLTGRRCVYSLLIGANDLSDSTPSAYLASLYTVADRIRATGAKLLICTILPKSSAWTGYANHNSYRATVNAQLRLDVVGNGGNDKFDAIADFANDATMGPDAAASNATYYGDGLHPTAAGHALLEPIWRAAVNSLLI